MAVFVEAGIKSSILVEHSVYSGIAAGLTTLGSTASVKVSSGYAVVRGGGGGGAALSGGANEHVLFHQDQTESQSPHSVQVDNGSSGSSWSVLLLVLLDNSAGSGMVPTIHKRLLVVPETSLRSSLSSTGRDCTTIPCGWSRAGGSLTSGMVPFNIVV
jgi:hypothetical protein